LRASASVYLASLPLFARLHAALSRRATLCFALHCLAAGPPGLLLCFQVTKASLIVTVISASSCFIAANRGRQASGAGRLTPDAAMPGARRQAPGASNNVTDAAMPSASGTCHSMLGTGCFFMKETKLNQD